MPAAPPYHCHEPLVMGWKGVLQSREQWEGNMEDEDSHKQRGKGNDGTDNEDTWGTKTPTRPFLMHLAYGKVFFVVSCFVKTTFMAPPLPNRYNHVT
jgi:hypothetical protein